MNATLLTSPFYDVFIADQFSDEQMIAYMVHFEVALARVQAAFGIIPGAVAERLIAVSDSFQPDVKAMRDSVETSAVPTIALVKQLQRAVGDEHASYVHWGATSQDVIDTALVLQLKACSAYLGETLQKTMAHLATLAKTHRHTLMAGRTHSQQALPITFGLKVAGWLAPLIRHQQRWHDMKPRLLVLQFGGGVGTLASLGETGGSVQEALADELGLGMLPMPWHTQRDTLVDFAGWLSLLTGSLAKMAQDIILMAQSEIAEVLESDDPSRGGSSTMPQKRNPVMSEVIIAAARQNANYLASLHQAMIQEHERATGGWQLEWLSLPQMLHLTASALKNALFLSKNLVINVAQMRSNIDKSRGLMLSEAVEMALAPMTGRTEAKRLIKEAVPIVLSEQRHLIDVLRERTQLDIHWESLRDEMQYLGQAQTLVDRVVAAVMDDS